MPFKKYILAFAFLFGITIAGTGKSLAQTPNFVAAKRFTMANMRKLVGSIRVRPHWIKGTNNFWYEYQTSEGKNWYYVNAENQSQRKIFNTKKMAARLTKIFHTPFKYRDLKLRRFHYNSKKGVFTFRVNGTSFNFNMKTNELNKQKPTKGRSFSFWKSYSPDSTWIAFAKNYNLYLMKANDADSTVYQLTTNGVRWFNYQARVGDTTNNKHVRARVRWFSDSKKFIVIRRDLRHIKPIYVIHSLHQPRPKLIKFKYAMPGDKYIPSEQIWVFKADTLSRTNGVKLKIKKKVWPDAGIGGGYSSRGIYMTSGSQYLYLLRHNRPYSKIDVLKCSTSTGDCPTLFSETDKPYFNPKFIQLAVINNGQQFIWWSERTGWGQLYRYNSEGKLMNRITHGFLQSAILLK